MTTHIIPMTYPPKLEGVFDGSIRQTIRTANRKKQIKVNDTLIIHEWSGKPYRSKWGRRLKVRVSEVLRLKVYDWGVRDEHGSECTWNAPGMSRLAYFDGIDPPTGSRLKEVLQGYHNTIEGEYVVIRW